MFNGQLVPKLVSSHCSMSRFYTVIVLVWSTMTISNAGCPWVQLSSADCIGYTLCPKTAANICYLNDGSHSDTYECTGSGVSRLRYSGDDCERDPTSTLTNVILEGDYNCNGDEDDCPLASYTDSTYKRTIKIIKDLCIEGTQAICHEGRGTIVLTKYSSDNCETGTEEFSTIS